MQANNGADHDLRLRTANFDRIARAGLGVRTDVEVAARLGVDPSTLSQLRHGRQAPSPRFIATALHHLPSATFERLFQVIERTARTA